MVKKRFLSLLQICITAAFPVVFDCQPFNKNEGKAEPDCRCKLEKCEAARMRGRVCGFESAHAAVWR